MVRPMNHLCVSLNCDHSIFSDLLLRCLFFLREIVGFFFWFGSFVSFLLCMHAWFHNLWCLSFTLISIWVNSFGIYTENWINENKTKKKQQQNKKQTRKKKERTRGSSCNQITNRLYVIQVTRVISKKIAYSCGSLKSQREINNDSQQQ